jgi:hypothetical protein
MSSQCCTAFVKRPLACCNIPDQRGVHWRRKTGNRRFEFRRSSRSGPSVGLELCAEPATPTRRRRVGRMQCAARDLRVAETHGLRAATVIRRDRASFARSRSATSPQRVETVRRTETAALRERLAKRSGPVVAKRVRATLGGLWSWGLRTGLIRTQRRRRA